ncbi:hypothetical protein NQZ68_039923 [Dissostichus eleginoides]|nr:hypothetical protein NQZ68_039923 [Dissostichus eleginoides]
MRHHSPVPFTAITEAYTCLGKPGRPGDVTSPHPMPLGSILNGVLVTAAIRMIRHEEK